RVEARAIGRARELAGPAVGLAGALDARERLGALGLEVDLTVAVVVLAVADLGRRAHGALAAEHAAHAAVAAGRARRRVGERRVEALDAGIALAHGHVVDDAVAVVVQAVADLFLGDARLVAAARDVVDHAVAVVVQAVADLRLRLDGPHAGAPG